jgi:hypothetical protein
MCANSALLDVNRPTTLLCRRPFRLDALKPALDAIKPSEERRRALVGCGVDLVDLVGGPGQVGVIYPRGHFIFFGLCKEPAKP